MKTPAGTGEEAADARLGAHALGEPVGEQRDHQAVERT